jgi:hypothetical protein
MMLADNLTLLVYVTVAVAGMAYYQWQSWKSSGEPFDLSKFVDTALSSGLFAVIGAAAGLANAGLSLSPEGLGALTGAFFLAAGIDTAYGKTLKALKSKT